MALDACSLLKQDFLNLKKDYSNRLSSYQSKTLACSRQKSEHLASRFEQLSKASWVVAGAAGGALLYKVCVIDLFRNELQSRNLAYLSVALGGATCGMKCSGRAGSYGRLAITYKEVEEWCAEPLPQGMSREEVKVWNLSVYPQRDKSLYSVWAETHTLLQDKNGMVESVWKAARSEASCQTSENQKVKAGPKGGFTEPPSLALWREVSAEVTRLETRREAARSWSAKPAKWDLWRGVAQSALG